jgi:hypothetical protein
MGNSSLNDDLSQRVKAILTFIAPGDDKLDPETRIQVIEDIQRLVPTHQTGLARSRPLLNELADAELLKSRHNLALLHAEGTKAYEKISAEGHARHAASTAKLLASARRARQELDKIWERVEARRLAGTGQTPALPPRRAGLD